MTSPEVATDTLERILQRQGGHIPMTPRDRDMMATAIHDLRVYRAAELQRKAQARTAEVIPLRRTRA